MPLIYDLADPVELQGFARGIQQEMEINRFVLSQFLPNQNIDELEFRITKGQLLDEDAAYFRAWDVEAPIGGRQGISRLAGELPPLSMKYRLGEEERLRKRALERQDNTGIVNAVYDDAAKAARAIAARVEMARGEALYAAQLTINENGFTQTIPFGRSGSMAVSPGTVWSTVATATPIQDENAWLTTYLGVNGIRPALALTSTAVVNNLALNAQYRSMAAFNGVTPPFLSMAGINQVRATYNLPPIVINDELVRVGGAQQRVIPSNRFIYLPPANEPLGRTFFGVTAEALELVGAQQISQDQAPGLTVVVEKTFDPVATWTKGSAVALPVLVNPDLTMVATVQ